MRCDDARAAISLRLDGERPGDLDVRELEGHTDACAECTGFERHAERVRAALRFEAVGAVPDLAPAVVARLQPPGASGRRVAAGGRAPRATAPRPRRPLVVAAALASLPVDLREAILLVEVLGLRYREVARVLGVPEGTVKSRVFNARSRLHRWSTADEERASGEV